MIIAAETHFAPTSEEATRIRVLGDGVLYDEARSFVAKYCVDHYPKPAQIQGLLEYSNDWNTLISFVKHQADDRDQHADKEFYQSLKRWLNEFRSRVQTEWGFTFGEMSKDQLNKKLGVFCGLLAQDFIQHLAAEMRYQSALNKR
jgi:hypothetical protein